MISFSKLLLEREHFGDSLRYDPKSKNQLRGTTEGKGPVVVWNCTRACNLKCRHCYAEASQSKTCGELTTIEAKSFMDSLVVYKVPVLLFSGGEPLLRRDIFELIEYGKEIGIRMVISTNGTLIDKEKALRIKELGVSYVGISLDGIGKVNDTFRGVQGAYEKAFSGFKNCKEVNQKTGLRLTLSRTTYKELSVIFDFIESEKISRVCFYHLAYSGRGSQIKDEDLTPEEKRKALDYIIEKTIDFGERNIKTEILTVDNHCDGIYLYNYMENKNKQKAEEILKLLTINGGNRSGIALSSVDWEGNVYIDQFTRSISVGNIKQNTFGDIWNGKENTFLQELRTRKNYLKGRCKNCKWIDQCSGNLRARALSTGDFWGSDPACYLSDEEIGIGEVGVSC
ncbi:radical SAM protein [Alkalibaculum sp. M08DMB]|uniref:Mycofactocin maturase MftC n=1 Tax=Alkalibaculum sporogenes TaxID=2655001 RepID=A0A6A7K6M0_9FIRM|nr:radical SAM protein [Alkalibaculum sporogenes]MPW25098.1 radical SAM protein [Alkalibaculum sporogenes]